MDIDEKTYAEIAEMIHSDSSPVGIDAKKTHILILHEVGKWLIHCFLDPLFAMLG